MYPRTIRQHQTRRETRREPGQQSTAAPASHCSSKLDEFEAKIRQLLERYPNITVTRILEELRKQGYDGRLHDSSRTCQDSCAVSRESRWSCVSKRHRRAGSNGLGRLRHRLHREGRRRVNLFSYVLGYSRRQYLCFTERQDFDATIRQHIHAFRHLAGLAATCLYDNMKVVVTRWEDDQPIYNTRFLSFATHYGYRPWACRPRRPETKGKVERPFHYVETSLLNGRTFRSLEHLNEVTRWWLANVADVRTHRTTKKRPVDAHAEEQPHLLPLPTHDYDTARVVYRVVDVEGCITYGNNQYSVPWRLVGEVLPVRMTETELFVYDRHIRQLARASALAWDKPVSSASIRHIARRQTTEQQLEQLRQRFANWEKWPAASWKDC